MSLRFLSVSLERGFRQVISFFVRLIDWSSGDSMKDRASMLHILEEEMLRCLRFRYLGAVINFIGKDQKSTIICSQYTCSMASNNLFHDGQDLVKFPLTLQLVLAKTCSLPARSCFLSVLGQLSLNLMRMMLTTYSNCYGQIL
jgi:hypothetical protein